MITIFGKYSGQISLAFIAAGWGEIIWPDPCTVFLPVKGCCNSGNAQKVTVFLQRICSKGGGIESLAIGGSVVQKQITSFQPFGHIPLSELFCTPALISRPAFIYVGARIP